jgi:cobalt-zinc-cadmium efflux system membrane fusion protein
MKSSRGKTLLYILFLGILTLVGCGGKQTENSSSTNVAETEHEGYDHGPGEVHGEAPATGDASFSDWCGEHSVPESECTKCNPSLIANFKESGDWCVGHDLPESHCRLCNPGIVFAREEISRVRTFDLAETEIGVSLNFRPNAAACATDGALIQFASATTAERAGLSVREVRLSQLESTDEAPAEILFDEIQMAAITTSVSAVVTRWLVSPGDPVARGDVLGILQSPEIAELRSELVTSHANYNLEKKEMARHVEMKKRNLISEADWDQQSAVTEKARAEYVSTRGLLLSAGLNESDITDILEHGSLSNQFALRAPADGVIIERIAKLGDLLNAGNVYATIGDPLAIWIEARLTERQLRGVEIGHQLTFSSDGRGINRVGGEIIWVSQFLDPHTRTGTVRARVLDPVHELHAGEFGRVHIVNKKHGNVAMIPKDAVQWEGCCNVVFVRESVDRYRPRKIQLLESNGPYYLVVEGVYAGEEVVVDGAFLLKTELKKSSIGAGCCGLEPAG